MQVACPNCKEQLHVPDEHIRRGVAKVRCAHCTFKFVIRLGDPGSPAKRQQEPTGYRLEGVKSSGTTATTSGEIGQHKSKFIAADTKTSIHVDPSFQEEIQGLAETIEDVKREALLSVSGELTDEAEDEEEEDGETGKTDENDKTARSGEIDIGQQNMQGSEDAEDAANEASSASGAGTEEELAWEPEERTNPRTKPAAPPLTEVPTEPATTGSEAVAPASPKEPPRTPGPDAPFPLAGPARSVVPHARVQAAASALPDPRRVTWGYSVPDQADPMAHLSELPEDAYSEAEPTPPPAEPAAEPLTAPLAQVAEAAPTLADEPMIEPEDHDADASDLARTLDEREDVQPAPEVPVPQPEGIGGAASSVSAVDAAVAPLSAVSAAALPVAAPPSAFLPSPGPAVPAPALLMPGMAPPALAYPSPLLPGSLPPQGAGPSYAFEDYSLTPARSGRAVKVFGILMTLVILVAGSLFLYILMRNDWSLDISRFDEMVARAFGLSEGTEVKPELRAVFVSQPILDRAKLASGESVLLCRGQVKNTDSPTLAYISVRGVLKRHGNGVLTAESPAGNTFTVAQLEKLTKSQVMASFNPAGQDGKNARVATGDSLDYALVLTPLPEDYEAGRYTVEVEASHAEIHQGQ